jgi:hypothetical protein
MEKRNKTNKIIIINNKKNLSLELEESRLRPKTYTVQLNPLDRVAQQILISHLSVLTVFSQIPDMIQRVRVIKRPLVKYK